MPWAQDSKDTNRNVAVGTGCILGLILGIVSILISWSYPVGRWFGTKLRTSRPFRYATLATVLFIGVWVVAGTAWTAYQEPIRRRQAVAAQQEVGLRISDEQIPILLSEEVDLFRQHGIRNAQFHRQILKVAEAYVLKAGFEMGRSQYANAMDDLSSALVKYEILRRIRLSVHPAYSMSIDQTLCEQLVGEFRRLFPATLARDVTPHVEAAIRKHEQQFDDEHPAEERADLRNAVVAMWLGDDAEGWARNSGRSW